MKKILAMLLVLVLVLAGCGGTADTPVEEEATVPQGKDMSLGRYEGGTYINDYVGFRLVLDENWTFYSAQELQVLPENVAQMFQGSELGDAIDPLTQFTDMMAENANEYASINVLYQLLDLKTRVAYAVLSTEQILDATLESADQMKEAYEQAGISVTSMEKVTVNFLGQERVALRTVATVQGIDYYILQVFDFHLGQYSATITVSSFLEDRTESLLTLFQPLA